MHRRVVSMARKLQKTPSSKKRFHGDRASKKPFSLLSSTIHKKKTKKDLRNPNRIPLGKNPIVEEMKSKKEEEIEENKTMMKKKKFGDVDDGFVLLSTLPASQQLRFFLHRLQSATGLKLSPLEIEAFRDTCMLELSQDMDQDVDNLSEHLKSIFGDSWRHVLCKGELSEGIDSGSPAILVISSSALRSLELLRGLKPFTRECRPGKLFAKHMKVEDQVLVLKGRVNIACGTPSRIKKLIDMGVMLLSRLAVVVLDMHRDVKGYSLITLPQVSAEFWDLYKSHFNSRLLEGGIRICFYGSISCGEIKKITEDGE